MPIVIKDGKKIYSLDDKRPGGQGFFARGGR